MGRPVGIEPTYAGATIRCVDRFATIAIMFLVNGSGGRVRTYDLTGMNRTLSPAELRRHKMAPQAGFEPATDRLTADCSTTELLWNNTMIFLVYTLFWCCLCSSCCMMIRRCSTPRRLHMDDSSVMFTPATVECSIKYFLEVILLLSTIRFSMILCNEL